MLIHHFKYLEDRVVVMHRGSEYVVNLSRDQPRHGSPVRVSVEVPTGMDYARTEDKGEGFWHLIRHGEYYMRFKVFYSRARPQWKDDVYIAFDAPREWLIRWHTHEYTLVSQEERREDPRTLYHSCVGAGRSAS